MSKTTIAVGLLILLGIVFLPELTKEKSVVSDNSYKNATYVIDGSPITLVGGISEVTGPMDGLKKVTKYYGNETYGDLNNDGSKDIAFVVTQNSGGTGTFYYVVVGLKTASGYKGTNAIMLGDRIKPESLKISQSQIQVDFLVRAEYEPMVAEPSLKVTRQIQLNDTRLEMDYE